MDMSEKKRSGLIECAGTSAQCPRRNALSTSKLLTSPTKKQSIS